MSNGTPDPITTAIMAAVEQYFYDLDGEVPGALYKMVFSRVEKSLLKLVLDRVKGNQTQAAALLGINRNTLRKKLHLYGLE